MITELLNIDPGDGSFPERLTRDEIKRLVIHSPIHSLFTLTSELRERFRGRDVDLCSIVNAKSGNCPEDCAYCAQSSRYRTEIDAYPLLPVEEIIKKAAEARASRAKRFCVVTSGKKPSGRELKEIASAITGIRKLGLLPCSTLGILNREELLLLKEAGLERYHHNLETSEGFFGNVCTTHTFEDKTDTIRAATEAGLSVCSGGIFGLGESWDDRLDMAYALREFDVDSVPVNFLIPIKGTPLQYRRPLHPLEALRIISMLRLILPDKEIRVCGGRLQVLGELNSLVFLAGADGLLVGHYLTREGRTAEDDLNLIEDMGLAY